MEEKKSVQTIYIAKFLLKLVLSDATNCCVKDYDQHRMRFFFSGLSVYFHAKQVIYHVWLIDQKSKLFVKILWYVAFLVWNIISEKRNPVCKDFCFNERATNNFHKQRKEGSSWQKSTKDVND